MVQSTAKPSPIAWIVAAIALALVGAALWFGGMYYAHGKMNSEATQQGEMSGVKMDGMAGMSGMGGMSGMQMGGMDSTGSESAGAKSEVPGYSKVRVSPELQQGIGVKIGVVEEAPLEMSVHTVGVVQPDETRVAHINLKTEGWVEKLFVNFTGQAVKKGDPLLAIYSPDFLSAQGEYLIARQAGRRSLDEEQPSLADASLRKMELWDVPEDEIEELEKTGVPRKSLTLRSPIDGTVLLKDVYEGMRVTPENDLYVVGDLSSVWVQAKVYEYELPHVELGHPVKVTVPAMPEREFDGKVNFIEPTLDESTRTVQVRVELPNMDGVLKPGMFVHVEIEHTMGKGLLVPTSAVLRTGERDLAFRVESGDQQGDRFVPVDVKLDTVNFGGRFHVLEGLKAGDRVVTSANFLIDSESRLRAGGGGMPGMPGMEMGNMKDTDKKGMKDSKMEGMDDAEMREMDDSTMNEMDHSKAKHSVK